MPTKRPKTRSRTKSVARHTRRGMPREAQAAYAEVQQSVKHLEKSIGEIQRGLRKAEQRIEADARARIRELRKAARAQLDVLRSKRREVTRTLKRLSAAAGESWGDVKRSVDSVIADARATAAAVVKRFRNALAG